MQDDGYGWKQLAAQPWGYTHRPPTPLSLQDSAAHRAFCTRGTYIRYLRARSWSLSRATKVGAPHWEVQRPGQARTRASVQAARNGRLRRARCSFGL